MNDTQREELSAYLDGALDAAATRALEARLSTSAELRTELEELRAVSKSLKELPRPTPSAGLIERVVAARVRGDTPRHDWVFLPPRARAAAFAASCGIVALVCWDKYVLAPPLLLPVAERASLAPAPQSAPFQQKKEDVIAEIRGGAHLAGASPAKGAPLAPAGAGVAAGGNLAEAAVADRAVDNAPYIQSLEAEKRRLGIRRASAAGAPARSRGEVAAAKIAAPKPQLLRGPEPGFIAASAQDLAAQWTRRGMPGTPPRLEPGLRLVVMTEPNSYIVSISSNDDTVVIRYAISVGQAPRERRAAAFPLWPAPVVFDRARP